MNDFGKNLNDILGLPLIQEKKYTVVEAEIVSETPTSKETDFEAARHNIKTLLRKGDDALDGILDLARSGEHPRSYEVAGQIIKTLVDANKELLSLHKQIKELDSDKEAEKPNNVTNAIFVGSTAELHKLIKGKKDV